MAPLRRLLQIPNITISSNSLFGISAGHSPFALRNCMMECTLHLAGLWISTAISNTSHSNKGVSTTAKRAQLTGKGLRPKAVLSHYA
jgi:hypothetical protein